MDINSSNYLSDIATRYGDALAELPEDNETALRTLIDSAAQLPCDETLEKQLRRNKALFAYRWALCRLQQALDPELLGELQTRYAETTIDKALQAAWTEPKLARYLGKAERSESGVVPGLFVLGLGKLGGYDLNFSSDVDLVAFYDPERLPVASVHGRSDVVTRVLQKMTQLLSKKIDGEFVWRVDWRLRPNASAISLCMPTESAEDFYFFHSYPWHRLSMIKARSIAGDIAAGEQFLRDLEPYLWRQNLDYQMVDEIFRLKEKINREHPQLKHARSTGAMYDDSEASGYNLKLGRGGIREIEFIVNGMQLLWGGKKPRLRHPNTLHTMQCLHDAGLLPEDARSRLGEAYRFYRLLEDALQILDNHQTQSLPRDEAALGQLLRLLGRDSDGAALWQELSEHRRAIKDIFERVFNARPPEAEPEVLLRAETRPWLAELPTAEKSIYENWQKGFICYGVNPAQASALQPLFVQLVEYLDDSSGDRAAAIARLHEFFNTIPRGGQYLRLLAQHRLLLRDIVTPLLHSPHMSSLLEQSPHIVDLLLEPQTLRRDEDEFDSEFVLQTTDFETRLERLRRFVNEQLYLHFLQLLRGEIGAPELQRTLTALAEHTLGLGLGITCEAMQLEQPPIAVIGMGKLGMRAMAPMSDLDLIFVAGDAVDLEHANEFSSRLQHLMELRTREGRAYEMDMRLRPSGRSGPATVSIRSFCDYQLGNARTWEHIALCAGRPVAGPPELQEAIGEVRCRVLGRARDIGQFKLDAARMLRRLQEQRIGKKNAGLDVKLRSGGLMELDYMSACACLLAQPTEQLCSGGYDDMVLACCAADSPAASLFAGESGQANFQRDVSEALRFWRRLQIWSRLTGLDDVATHNLPPVLEEAMLEDMRADSLADLEQRVTATSATVSSAITALQQDFEREAPASWDSWQEAPVRWVDGS